MGKRPLHELALVHRVLDAEAERSSRDNFKNKILATFEKTDELSTGTIHES
jgi:hypothetical protein